MTDYKGIELQKRVLQQSSNKRSHFSLQRTQSGRAKDNFTESFGPGSSKDGSVNPGLSQILSKIFLPKNTSLELTK